MTITRCPYCLSSDLIKRGFSRLGAQQYECKHCGKYHNEMTGKIKSKNAKILVFDIETSPLQVFVWGLKPNFIHPDRIIKDWFVISWAAKWYGERKIMSGVLKSKEAISGNDERIVKGIWELFNEADIVVAHNGDRFDISRLNSRFLVHGMSPPLPYKSIDTLKSVRRVFGFTANHLDTLTKKLKIGEKIETDFQLWEDCVNGVPSGLKKMVRYNIHDVKILEKFYTRIRSWIPNHPHTSLYMKNIGDMPCPICKTKVEISTDKIATTPSTAWYIYRCPKCGHTDRTKVRVTTKEDRKKLITK